MKQSFPISTLTGFLDADITFASPIMWFLHDLFNDQNTVTRKNPIKKNNLLPNTTELAVGSS